MVVVGLDEGNEMDALTAILLPALGTYDGRLVLVTEPAISCAVPTVILQHTFISIAHNKATCLQVNEALHDIKVSTVAYEACHAL